MNLSRIEMLRWQIISPLLNQYIKRNQLQSLFLLYHIVTPATPLFIYQGMGGKRLIGEWMFKRFIGFIQSLRNYVRFLTIHDAINAYREGQKGIYGALSFDDGLAEISQVIAPTLRQLGITATFFICTAPLISDQLLPFHEFYWYVCTVGVPFVTQAIQALGGTILKKIQPKLPVMTVKRIWMELCPDQQKELLEMLRRYIGKPNLSERIYLTAEEVKSLSEQGFEIASHTVTHPVLTKLCDEELRRELVESKKVLENIVGKSIYGFAHPYGQPFTNSSKVESEILRAGYNYAALVGENFTFKLNSEGLILVQRVSMNLYSPERLFIQILRHRLWR